MVVIVAVLGLIVIGNVVLTMAVLRRLAAHERKLAALAPILSTPSGPRPGSALPAFTARTTTGAPITESQLSSGPAVVAFFSAHCSSCREEAPGFAALAEDLQVPALAVLSGDGGSTQPLLDALGAVAVVHEPEPGGAVVSAFEVSGYPTYLAVEDGVVVGVPGSTDDLGALLAPART